MPILWMSSFDGYFFGKMRYLRILFIFCVCWYMVSTKKAMVGSHIRPIRPPIWQVWLGGHAHMVSPGIQPIQITHADTLIVSIYAGLNARLGQWYRTWVMTVFLSSIFLSKMKACIIGFSLTIIWEKALLCD